MRRLHWVSSVTLIAAMTSVSFPALSVIGDGLAADQENKFSTKISQNNQKSLWDRLFRPKEAKGGSRGEFCSIWPSKTDNDLFFIWNTHPLFVWHGNVKRIEFGLPYYKYHNKKPLWSYDVRENEQSLLYSGPPLQVGQEYHFWATYEVTKDGKTTTRYTETPIAFKIMGDEDLRNSIEEQLAVMENQDSTVNAEDIALQKAEYFANKGLYSDVIREIFLVNNPSPELASVIEKIRNEPRCAIKPKSID